MSNHHGMDISIIKIARTFNSLKNSFKTSKMYFEGFIEFFAFHRFRYHVLVEHDEKHPQPKFGRNQFKGARDMAT